MFADREAQRRARQEQAEAAEAMAAANKEMEDEEAAAQEVQQAEAKLKKAEEEGLSSAIVQHLRVLAANKRKEFRVRLTTLPLLSVFRVLAVFFSFSFPLSLCVVAERASRGIRIAQARGGRGPRGSGGD